MYLLFVVDRNDATAELLGKQTMTNFWFKFKQVAKQWNRIRWIDRRNRSLL